MNVKSHPPHGYRRSGSRCRRYLRASFTIEAALLVPMILAVLFLLLQMVLYFHDTVTAEAWLYQETWKLRWNEEQAETVFEQEAAPAMAVLRQETDAVTKKGNNLRQETTFQVALLPDFVTVLWNGQPEQLTKRSNEQNIQPWRFVRIAGAILEEWEEWSQ